tara:strand:- start:17 stop:1141 length:1125 start_codon:yes stop_codon:yes gene_type:complete
MISIKRNLTKTYTTLKKKLSKNRYVIIFIAMVVIWVMYLLLKDIKIIENFGDKEIPTLPRPFVNLYDDKGKKINVICVSHPFTRNTGTNGSYEQYVEWKAKGIHFIGISSYSEFPALVTNPHDSLSNKDMDAWKKYDYMELCEAWLHCFRHPDKYITAPIPKALISESDFTSKKHQPDPNIKKEYDFIYVCLKDNDKCEAGWQSYIRNWELAKKCLEVMCSKFKLKGLLVGRVNCDLPESCHTGMEIKDFMPQNEFFEQYKKSKFVFVPNIVDASPRVLTEALCYNLPCLVNYNILGGWKYVNEHTGEFFHNEEDFEQSLRKLLNNLDNYTPSKYFRENYGKHTTGVELKDFLCENLKDINFTKDSTKYISIGK